MAKFLSDRQGDMPGMGADDVGGLLRLKATAAIKPAAPQKPCDVGLFGDDARQLDFAAGLAERKAGT
jgi:hypothetical protein